MKRLFLTCLALAMAVAPAAWADGIEAHLPAGPVHAAALLRAGSLRVAERNALIRLLNDKGIAIFTEKPGGREPAWDSAALRRMLADGAGARLGVITLSDDLGALSRLVGGGGGRPAPDFVAFIATGAAKPGPAAIRPADQPPDLFVLLDDADGSLHPESVTSLLAALRARQRTGELHILAHAALGEAIATDRWPQLLTAWLDRTQIKN